MVFNSLSFLVFISVFLLLYFGMAGRARLWLCLTGSYVFYGWWDWRFLGLILLSTVVDYVVGIRLDVESRSGARRRLLATSVVVNLGILGFFKYFDFFTDSFSNLLRAAGVNASVPALSLVLPVGISFYTFQSMSYTIDLYRRKIDVERDFLRFATFIAFFPQLVAGPIVRAGHFLPQLSWARRLDWERINAGATQVLWGFFKKVAVADSLAPFVDLCFAAPRMYSSLHLTLGVVFYSFQIYCDFSGYSDIAIGLARMMGFDFPENFRKPYFSRSFSEFWRRWHVSLSGWLRDYLYVPLGGNRLGTARTYANLTVTMLLGGLWHGASWTFVFWGLLHGSYLVVQRLLSGPYGRATRALRVPSVVVGAVNMLAVYVLTCLAWVYFRSPSFEVANQYLAGILAFDGLGFSGVVNKFQVAKGLLLVAVLLTVEIFDSRTPLTGVAVRVPAFRLAALATMLWLIAFFGTFDANPFIYFQF